jgi:cytochrome b561
LAKVADGIGSAGKYDLISQIAHWLTFLLVAAEFTVGWCMPEVEWGTEPVGLIAVHLAIGATLTVVVLFRIVWRFTHRAPRQLSLLPAWQRAAARLTHALLYIVLVAMLGSGWASASARQWPVRAFGIVPLPPILPPETKLGFELGDKHADVISWLLIGLIGVHVLAAIYHQFIKRDGVLDRMLPNRRSFR